MIKASGKAFGQPLLFLGISAENVTRLVAGEPILIRAEEVATLGLPPVAIALHYGKTEQAILDEIGDAGVELKRGKVDG